MKIKCNYVNNGFHLVKSWLPSQGIYLCQDFREKRWCRLLLAGSHQNGLNPIVNSHNDGIKIYTRNLLFKVRRNPEKAAITKSTSRFSIFAKICVWFRSPSLDKNSRACIVRNKIIYNRYTWGQKVKNWTTGLCLSTPQKGTYFTNIFSMSCKWKG